MTMREPAKGRIHADGAGATFATLAQQAHLPPRVRAVLDGLLLRCGQYFGAALIRTLDEIERELFQLAERSNNNAVQQERFTELREIKIARNVVVPHFLQHVEGGLAQMRGAARNVAPVWNLRSEAPGDALELIDALVFEEELALQEVASKSEMRHNQALYALAHRLGVVAGTPAWPNEILPLGPAQFADAFRHALSDVSLGVAQRVLAYRQFDRVAMLPIGPFYDRVNAWLAVQRVLPNLSIQSAFRRIETEHDVGAEPTPPQPQPAQTQARATGAGTAPTPSAQVDDIELFETLRGLLGARRESWGAAIAETPTFHAGSADLQSVLGALQRGPASRTAAATAYDSEHFKNVLAVKLRRASPEGHPLSLTDEDSDTVDLVGMLFDYITRNVRDGSGALTLLTRLHVPVLRLALGDKTFFTRRDHPARALLNTIAETGAHWVEESDADPELLKKMQLVVNHVGSEFDGDVGLFENQLDDLGRHMQMLARRAEIVERRHIDAAKGRDKLDVARENAREAIGHVLQASVATSAVRTLLEHAWTDALALSALREGAHGAQFKRRIAIAEQLTQRAPAPAVGDIDEALRSDLDAGLRQVGLHDEDVRGVVGCLFPPADATGPLPSAELARITSTLRDKTRLGGDAEPSALSQSARGAPTLDKAEAAMLEKLHKIPFGTWFDFVTNQQGLSVRRKLAWFSTMTGRCLFVNQRGARSEDRTLEQLAREMARNQARIVVAESNSMIDRAWKAIVEVLHPHAAEPTHAGHS